MVRISAVLIKLVGVTIMLWPRLSGTGDLQEGAALGALLILIATIARAFVQVASLASAKRKRGDRVLFLRHRVCRVVDNLAIRLDGSAVLGVVVAGLNRAVWRHRSIP